MGQGETRFSLPYTKSNGGISESKTGGHKAGEKEPTELPNLCTKSQLQQTVKLSESNFKIRV